MRLKTIGEVKAPVAARLPDLVLTLNGQGVTAHFEAGPTPGTFTGVAGGMRLGANRLQATLRAPHRAEASLVVWCFYRSTDGTFEELTDRTSSRPAVVATTTTSEGRTVPYIVRIDSGTQYVQGTVTPPGVGRAAGVLSHEALPRGFAYQRN